MSNDYREETQYEVDSEEGDHVNHTAGTDIDGTLVEQIMNEIAGLDNFDINAEFTIEEWRSFSTLLRKYISAWKFSRKVPYKTSPKTEIPDSVEEATLNDNVTIRHRTSHKVEQDIVGTRVDEVEDSSTRKTPPTKMKVEDIVEGGDVVTETSDKAETAGVDPVSDKSEDMSWLYALVPSKREFHDSIRVITDRLAEIPQELEAHEVVLKEEVSAMGEKVMSVMGDKIQESNGKLMAEIGLLLSGVLPGLNPAVSPVPDLSVNNRIPFMLGPPATPVVSTKLPNGLNTPAPMVFPIQAPMGTLMTQRAMMTLPSPVQPVMAAVNRQLSYSSGAIPVTTAPSNLATNTTVPPEELPVVKIIAQKDPTTWGLRLRNMELGALIDFLYEYRIKLVTEEHQGFKLTKFLTSSQLNSLYQHAKQEGLYSGRFHDFIKLKDDAHLSLLYHMVKAENVEEYRSAMKHVKFAWIEGTDINYSVISDFLQKAQDYTAKFQEVIEILNVHTEPRNIPPMHAPNRSVKVTLLGCYLDGFPNREGEGKCNTVGWRVYDAANQASQMKPQNMWKDIEQFSECLMLEFRRFWKSSKQQMEDMRILNTRKILERRLPVSTAKEGGQAYRQSTGTEAGKPAYKPNVRRFMDRSGKVFTLGSRDPLPQPDESSPSKPTVEELEDEVASIQDEEGPDELDTQQDPEYIDDDESDPAYLDHIGQLSGKGAKPDAYGGCYTKFYSPDGVCTKGSKCKWDHTDKGMEHCAKQTVLRCRRSKFYPSLDKIQKWYAEPAPPVSSKPADRPSKRS
jgi:hypothetical protein